MFGLYMLFHLCRISLAFAEETPTPSVQAPASPTVDNVHCTTLPNGRYYPAHRYCTPVPGLNEDGDDAPAIQAAIDKAGNDYGFVWLAENQTYTLKSPIRWKDTQWVGLYIGGTLQIAGSEDDWAGVEAIISVTNVTKWHLQGAGSSMHSSGPKIVGRGAVDGSMLRWNNGSAKPPPALFHLTDSHYIHPRDVDVKNAPGTYFRFEDCSHVDAHGIQLLTESGFGRPDTFGVFLGNTDYVFFDGVTVRFNESMPRTGHCFTVDSFPSHGIHAKNIDCRNAVTGVTVMLGASNTVYRVGETVVATHFDATNLTVEADIATGVLNMGKYPHVLVDDVVYDNVTVLGDGELAVVEDCWEMPGQVGPGGGCGLLEARGDAGVVEVKRSYTNLRFLNYRYFGRVRQGPKERMGDVVVSLFWSGWKRESDA